MPSAEDPLLSPTGLSPSVVQLSRMLQLGGAFVTPPPAPARRRRMTPQQPQGRNAQGLARPWFGLFPFRSPLLGESRFLSFPAGTKMCQFPALAPAPYLFRRRYPSIYLGWVAPFGHLRITASGSYPELIAANHVLHRLWAPRHPPHTLGSLTATIPALSGGIDSLSTRDSGPDCRSALTAVHLVKEQPTDTLAAPPQYPVLYQAPRPCQARFFPGVRVISYGGGSCAKDSVDGAFRPCQALARFSAPFLQVPR